MPAPDGFPLIVMGMHRSGTSLVAGILDAAGVHMGADRNSHDESYFFRELNDVVFGAAHAAWDWPLALSPLFADDATCEAIAAELARRCASSEARAYLGWRRWLQGGGLAGQKGPWGWKDPRNTCTLPFWLRIFPGARVINVYRDGVDVVASLVTRERQRRGRLDSGVRSSRCLDPDRAFELWAEYVEISLDVTEDLPPSRVRDVRYESLLEKPELAIRDLLSFSGVEPGEEIVRGLAAGVKPNPGGRRNPEFDALRERVADHPLMRRLEYGAPA
jgi:hypothetical protein